MKIKKYLVASAAFAFCMGIAPATHAEDNLELFAQAWETCEYDPGFAVLGYGNFDACLQSVYNDLLNEPPEEPPSTPGGFGCIGSRIPGIC